MADWAGWDGQDGQLRKEHKRFKKRKIKEEKTYQKSENKGLGWLLEWIDGWDGWLAREGVRGRLTQLKNSH